MSYAITYTTDGSQDNEITCLKVSKPYHKRQKLLREHFQAIKTEEPSPFVVDGADLDLDLEGVVLYDLAVRRVFTEGYMLFDKTSNSS